MDQSTSVLSEDVTPVLHNREAIAEKLVALECCLTDAAEDVTATYTRMLKETTDGVERLVDQTATALNPVHHTQGHRRVMLDVALCAGYVIGQVADPRSAGLGYHEPAKGCRMNRGTSAHGAKPRGRSAPW